VDNLRAAACVAARLSLFSDQETLRVYSRRIDLLREHSGAAFL
jgi:hypothetical protein